ncbi:hypothetical protein PRK78_002124 [Emydomyces testavorans]|uniref:F-box domain-containing protein n=1 Tax=Emydomyces testavorans TaxID=2070801 RepID=A0AAF0DFH7_9EURO|nr:hypothetical protein PRK78_002124 [Emydomyces testavorans]
MPFLNIPVELFENIISLLPVSDLVTLTQVSKLLNAAIVPRLYAHTVLKLDSIECVPLKEDPPNYEVWLEALKGLVSNTQNQCSSVRKLTICGEFAFGENTSKDIMHHTKNVSRSPDIQAPIPEFVNCLLEMAVPQMTGLIDVEWHSGIRPSIKLFRALATQPLRSLSFNAGLMLCYYHYQNAHCHVSLKFSELDFSRVTSLHFFNLYDLESIEAVSRVIFQARNHLKDLRLHFSRPLIAVETRDLPLANVLHLLCDELEKAEQPLQLQKLGIYACGRTVLADLFQFFDFSSIKDFSFVPKMCRRRVDLSIWNELRQRGIKFSSLMTDQAGEGMDAYFSSFEGLRKLFLQYVSSDLAVSPLCAQHWSTLRTIFLPPGQHTMHDVPIIIRNCPRLEELGMVLYTASMRDLFKILDHSHNLKSIFIYNSYARPNLTGLGTEMSAKVFIKKFVDFFACSARRQNPQNLSTFYHRLEKLSFHDALWEMTSTSMDPIEGSAYDFISRHNHPRQLRVHDTSIIPAIKVENRRVLRDFKSRGVTLLPIRVPWTRYRGDNTIERLIDYLVNEHEGRTYYPYIQANRFVEPRLRY